MNSSREVQRKLLYNKEKFFKEEGRQILSPNSITTQELKHISVELLAVLLAAALSATVSALPQAPVSANELKQNSAGSKYDEDSEAIDTSVLIEIFVAPAAPVEYIEDTANKNCTHYADYGFHCVQYYQCKGGTIIKDDAGLFDSHLDFLPTLDPTESESKCPGALEVSRFWLYLR